MSFGVAFGSRHIMRNMKDAVIVSPTRARLRMGT
jgi:hypothetical protein